MADSRTLEILLKIKDLASKELTGIAKATQDLKPQFKDMALLGTAGFATLTAGIYSTVSAYAESEKQLQIVDSLIDNFGTRTLAQFGGSTQMARDRIRAFGADIQALGGIADEEASVGLAKLLQITGDYTTATEGARLATDLSVYKNMEYSEAVNVVGKVLSGNTSILTKYGIVLDENATKEQAVAKLQNMMGGLYEKNGKTISGQMKILRESVGDLQEEIGKAFVPALTQTLEAIKPVVLGMTQWAKENPKLIATITEVGLAVSGFLAVAGTIGVIIPKIASTLALLKGALLALTGPWGLLIAGVTALGYALNYGITYNAQKALDKETELALASMKMSDEMRKAKAPASELASEIANVGKVSKETADKIKNLEKEITDGIKDNAQKQQTYKEDLAQNIIEQENKIIGIKQDIRDKESEMAKASDSEAWITANSELQTLKAKLVTEEDALTRSKDVKIGIEAELVEMRRRANLTDFENKQEMIMRNRLAELNAYKEKLLQQVQEMNDLKAQRVKELQIETSYHQSTTAVITTENDAKARSYEDMASRIKKAMSSIGQTITTGIQTMSMATQTSTPAMISAPVTPKASGNTFNFSVTGNQFLSQDAVDIMSGKLMDSLRSNTKLSTSW